MKMCFDDRLFFGPGVVKVQSVQYFSRPGKQNKVDVIPVLKPSRSNGRLLCLEIRRESAPHKDILGPDG